MNPTISLFSDIAELLIYQTNSRTTVKNNDTSRNQKQQQRFNFDGAVTKFDKMLNTMFSTVPNDELEHIMLNIEEEMIGEFGICIQAETDENDYNDRELKQKSELKIQEVKQKLKQYDGLDISVTGYKNEGKEDIHQKIVFSDPDTKEFVASIPLTDSEDKGYDFYYSIYIAMMISKFGRKVLFALGKQLTTSDVATFGIFDTVSRQMIYNPYAKISNWICAMKYVNNTYLPIIGGYLLADNKLSLTTLYTLLVSNRLPTQIIKLYEFTSSAGSVNEDEEYSENGPFINRDINNFGKLIITIIAPSGLEIKRMLNIRHRVSRKRTRIIPNKNVKYRDLVRNFGNEISELVET